MNIFSFMVEALVKRGGYFLAIWLIPIFAVVALYRAYDVRLSGYELGGMGFVYGALVLAGIQSYHFFRTRVDTTDPAVRGVDGEPRGTTGRAAATEPRQGKTARRRRNK